MKRHVRPWMAALSAVFAFRLAFGLSRPFFYEDETQIFLLGLRYHATGQWPFFGPDVVWTRSEIPGALQALLVGVPLNLFPIPEAPFILTNLLSFVALCALAWYACAQLPQAPRWLIWGWFLTVPWTLQFSTHVINPSYVLPAAIVFFIAFFEALPTFSLGSVPRPAAFALMGAAIVWIMQVHMSWPLLLPFLSIAWLAARAEGMEDARGVRRGVRGRRVRSRPALDPDACAIRRAGGFGWRVQKHSPPWREPVDSRDDARAAAVVCEPGNRALHRDGRREAIRFLPPSPVARAICGDRMDRRRLQPLWMLVDGLRFSRPRVSSIAPARWNTLRRLVGFAVLVVYASYWLVMEPPQAHAFYSLAPLALVFAAFWWVQIDSPRMRTIAGIVLALNVCFHAGLAWAQGSELSLYTNRAPVAAAIALRQPEMFAHRRDFAVDAGPYTLAADARSYDVRRDIEIVAAPIQDDAGPSLRWTVTVRNHNDHVAFRDLLYSTTYLDDHDSVVEQRHERIKEIFEPGAMRIIDLNDGYAKTRFARARLEVVAGEALLPLPH
jgi:hypothetical protein